MAYYLNFFMLYGVLSEQLFSYLLDRYKDWCMCINGEHFFSDVCAA